MVPDDHVAGLKDHWRQQILDLDGRGLSDAASHARRQMARVRGLGFGSEVLDAKFAKSAKAALRERQAGYMSLGAALALTFGPDFLELGRTGSLQSQATERWVRAGTLFGASSTAAYSLKHIARGSWRGNWKGNGLVSVALLLPDGYFTVQDFGGTREAFSNGNFYCQMSGKVAGTALAFAVFAPVSSAATAITLGTPAAPAAPIIGPVVGGIASAGAYVVGSVSTESTTRWCMEGINPELLYEAERKMVDQVNDDLAARITSLQNSVPLPLVSPNISQ